MSAPAVVEVARPDSAGHEAAPFDGLGRAAVVAGAVVVLAAGLVLRFWSRSHLWLDEALTVNIARLPLRQLPRALRHDGAPPLYYVVLHLWMRLFGTSTAAVRALSGVLAVITLPLVWRAGRRLGADEDAALVGGVAVLLLASSPFAIRYATEARMYSLVALLTVLGYLALARVLERDRPTPLDIGAVGLVSGLLLLSHYWSLYLLATVAGALLIKGRRGGAATRRQVTAACAGLALGFVLFLPWLPSLVFQLRHTGTPWAVPASFSAMVNAIGEFAGGRSSSGRALGLLFFALAGFGLFGAAVDGHRVEIDLRTRPRARGMAVTVAGTLAIAIGIGFATRGAFAARYAAVVFVPFLLLVAAGTVVFVDRRVLAGVIAAAVAFGLVTSTGNVTTDRTQAGQLARELRSQLRPGDVVGYCPDQLAPAESRLLPRNVTQVTFPRYAGPSFVDWVDYGATVRASDPSAFARFLDRQAGPGHTVWMIWASLYRTLGTDCEQINAQLSALRPQTNQLIEADTQHFFEHANLVRYLPR